MTHTPTTLTITTDEATARLLAHAADVHHAHPNDVATAAITFYCSATTGPRPPIEYRSSPQAWATYIHRFSANLNHLCQSHADPATIGDALGALMAAVVSFSNWLDRAPLDRPPPHRPPTTGFSSLATRLTTHHRRPRH